MKLNTIISLYSFDFKLSKRYVQVIMIKPFP